LRSSWHFKRVPWRSSWEPEHAVLVFYFYSHYHDSHESDTLLCFVFVTLVTSIMRIDLDNRSYYNGRKLSR
jgi:hypothetical protein